MTRRKRRRHDRARSQDSPGCEGHRERLQSGLTHRKDNLAGCARPGFVAPRARAPAIPKPFLSIPQRDGAPPDRPRGDSSCASLRAATNASASEVAVFIVAETPQGRPPTEDRGRAVLRARARSGVCSGLPWRAPYRHHVRRAYSGRRAANTQSGATTSRRSVPRLEPEPRPAMTENGARDGQALLR
jgi:hypothetical protein